MNPRTWLHNGKYLTASEVAALNPRLKPATVHARLRAGKSVEEAIGRKLSASEAGRRGRAASTRIEFGRAS